MFIFWDTLENLDVYLEEGGISIKISVEEKNKKTRKISKVYLCLHFKINKEKLLFQHHKY